MSNDKTGVPNQSESDVRFVWGSDITFGKHGEKFAVDPMGVFRTVDEAVAENAKLHSSFGYDIYEVEAAVTPKLVRSFGFRQGTQCNGFKVKRRVCAAYDHPAWQSRI